MSMEKERRKKGERKRREGKKKVTGFVDEGLVRLEPGVEGDGDRRKAWGNKSQFFDTESITWVGGVERYPHRDSLLRVIISCIDMRSVHQDVSDHFVLVHDEGGDNDSIIKFQLGNDLTLGSAAWFVFAEFNFGPVEVYLLFS